MRFYCIKNARDVFTETVDKALTSKVSEGDSDFSGHYGNYIFLYVHGGRAGFEGYFELTIGWLSNLVGNGLSAAHAAEWVNSLVVDGIIGGVGTIVTFLPKHIDFVSFLWRCWGGQRIYGPCGICHGGHYEQTRAFGESVYSHVGLSDLAVRCPQLWHPVRWKANAIVIR